LDSRYMTATYRLFASPVFHVDREKFSSKSNARTSG
jgi:hypothetical protein